MESYDDSNKIKVEIIISDEPEECRRTFEYGK